MEHSIPNLKTALEEIKIILDNYDLAAVVVVHGLAGTGNLLKVDPSYSCAKFTGNGDHIHLSNVHLETQEEKKIILEDTLEMIEGLGVNTGNKSLAFLDAYKQYEEHFENKKSTT